MSVCLVTLLPSKVKRTVISRLFLCRKGDLGGHFLAVYEEWLARCLVHKDAFNGVFLTDRKVLVGKRCPQW